MSDSRSNLENNSKQFPTPNFGSSSSSSSSSSDDDFSMFDNVRISPDVRQPRNRRFSAVSSTEKNADDESNEDAAIAEKLKSVMEQLKHTKKELKQKRLKNRKLLRTLHDAIYRSLNSESCDPPSDIAVYPYQEPIETPATLMMDTRKKDTKDFITKAFPIETNKSSKKQMKPCETLSANFNCLVDNTEIPATNCSKKDKKSSTKKNPFFDYEKTLDIEEEPGDAKSDKDDSQPSSFTADLRQLRHQRQQYRRRHATTENKAPSVVGNEENDSLPRKNRRKQVHKQMRVKPIDGAATQQQQKPICHLYHPDNGFKPYYSGATAGPNRESILPQPPKSIANFVDNLRAEYSARKSGQNSQTTIQANNPNPNPTFPYWNKPRSPLTQYPFVPIPDTEPGTESGFASMLRESNNFLASIQNDHLTTTTDLESKYFAKITDQADELHQPKQSALPKPSRFSVIIDPPQVDSNLMMLSDDDLDESKEKSVNEEEEETHKKPPKCEASFHRESALKKFCNEIQSMNRNYLANPIIGNPDGTAPVEAAARSPSDAADSRLGPSSSQVSQPV